MTKIILFLMVVSCLGALTTCVSGDKIIRTPTFSCPNGWHLYSQRNKCIKNFDTPMSWKDARSFCQQKGGDFVRIFDKATNNFIKALVNDSSSSYWIGLHNSKNVYEFQWTDDSLLNNYDNWYQGIPRASSRKMCVKVMGSQGRQWQVESCIQRNSFVCEHHTSTEIPSFNCPENWTEYPAGKKCFNVYKKKYHNFNHAKAYCKSKGGQLLKIPDAATQNFIDKMLASYPYSYYFIGLRRSEYRSDFWTDRAPLTGYSNYVQPEVGRWECVALARDHGFKWVPYYCYNSIAWICEKTPKYEEPTLNTCPPEWNILTSRETCIRIVNNKKSWNDARSYCQGRGGDLVTVPSQTYTNFIRNDLAGNPDKYFWIGLKHDIKGNVYRWVDNTTLVAHYKFQRQPNYNDENQCARISSVQNYAWSKYTCTGMVDFICEQPAQTKAVYCPKEYNVYVAGKKCIQVVKGMKTWNDARTYCKQQGGDLVTIEDDATDKFIATELQKIGKANYWIGLNYSNQARQYSWVDSIALAGFDKWSQGQKVHKNGQNCVQLYRDFNWYQAGCNQRSNSICQRTAQVTDVHCPIGWKLYKKELACIQVFHYYKDWKDSRTFCQSLGGDLVTIHEEDKDLFVVEVIENRGNGDYFWIGLSKTGGQMKWVDNSLLTFQNLVSSTRISDVREGDGIRIERLYQYAWQPSGKYESNEFVCERRASTDPYETTTTTASTTMITTKTTSSTKTIKSTTTPMIVTTTSKIATTMRKITTTPPKIATTTEKITSTTPKVATTMRKITTTIPKIATTTTNITTITPKINLSTGKTRNVIQSRTMTPTKAAGTDTSMNVTNIVTSRIKSSSNVSDLSEGSKAGIAIGVICGVS